MHLPCTPCVPMPYPSPFPSFGNLNNIIWTIKNTSLLSSRILPLALSVCPLPQTTCTYHVHCATDSTLPLTMSTKSVDRAADGTEVCRPLCFLYVSGLIVLGATEIWGWCNECYFCVLCVRYILYIVYVLCILYMLCIHCTLYLVYTLWVRCVLVS